MARRKIKLTPINEGRFDAGRAREFVVQAQEDGSLWVRTNFFNTALKTVKYSGDTLVLYIVDAETERPL